MEQLIEQIKAFFALPFVVDVIASAIILLITALAAKWVVRFLRHILRSDEVPLPSSSIFLNIARGIVWMLGICIVLQSRFDVNVSALIAALGVGGIAVSLGFKDTVANLIGGLQVTLMHLVEPGDNIAVSGVCGVVKDVTWRHTTIVASTGEDITIPNAIINNNSLTHLGSPEQMVVPFVVVGTDADLEATAQRIKTGATEAAASVSPVTQEVVVLFTEVIDTGFRGKVLMRITDAQKVAAATDAVVRAIAPITRW
ncbi:MAG: mechanosensitive ion channel family protein [Raoultibacter sp.]